MSNISMFSYAWDIAENGVSKSVDEMKKIGINTVSLATSYHAGKFLRPKSKISKVYFPEDGTIYFEPDESRYGEIRPIRNTIFGNGKLLRDLTTASEFYTNAWLVLLHNTPLGMRYQNACVQNAFGDAFIYALCPSAPVAREYAVALTSDVSENYDISGITLESVGFPPFEHGYHHEMSFVKPNRWLSKNLGLCFCKYCISGAEVLGIDAKTLKAKVANSIHEYLEGDFDLHEHDADSKWLDDVASDCEFERFLDFRSGVVTSLIGEIRGAVGKSIEVSVIPSVAGPTVGAWYEGSDLKAISQTGVDIEACFYQADVRLIKSDLSNIKDQIINSVGTGKIKGVLRPSHPDLTSETKVIEAVRALMEGGVSDIGFYNYGHLRSQSLNWIKEALVAAHR